MVHEIPAEWLPVRCETNRPSGPMGPDGLFVSQRNSPVKLCRISAALTCSLSSEVIISVDKNFYEKSHKLTVKRGYL